MRTQWLQTYTYPFHQPRPEVPEDIEDPRWHSGGQVAVLLLVADAWLLLLFVNVNHQSPHDVFPPPPIFTNAFDESARVISVWPGDMVGRKQWDLYNNGFYNGCFPKKCWLFKITTFFWPLAKEHLPSSLDATCRWFSSIKLPKNSCPAGWAVTLVGFISSFRIWFTVLCFNYPQVEPVWSWKKNIGDGRQEQCRLKNHGMSFQTRSWFVTGL